MAYERPREHYRIQYPLAARPHFLVEGRRYQVVDLSETGMRLRLDRPDGPEVGGEIRGTIRFRRGEEVVVAGVVVRVADDHAAVRLDIPLPFRVVLDEQRYLRERHRGMAW